MCRLPVARAAFLKFEECHLPTTLLVNTASSEAPRKLASQAIAKPASLRPEGPERPETGPWCGTGRTHPLELLNAPPVWVASLAALCTTHILENRAQFCTNEKSLLAPDPRTTPTNHYYLDKIGSESPNPAQPAPSCALPQARSRRPSRESVLPVAHSCSSVFIRGPMFSANPCTVLHKRKTPAAARSPHNPNKSNRITVRNPPHPVQNRECVFPAKPPTYSCSFVFIRGPMFFRESVHSNAQTKPAANCRSPA